LRKNVNVHHASIVESDSIGEGTTIWAFTHVLKGAEIGSNCNICDHCYIEYGVTVGDNVTVKCGNILYEGLTIENDVFIGPMVKFTNDAYPRSSRSEVKIERYNKKESWLKHTLVKKGASLGAGSIILPGLTIGKYAMIAAGTIVTRSVPDYALILGSPGKFKTWVCRCGLPLKFDNPETTCNTCGLDYVQLNENEITLKSESSK